MRKRIRPAVAAIRAALRKARSAVGIVRTFHNWPTVLRDHLGLARKPYVSRVRKGPRFLTRPGTDDTRVLFEIFVSGCYRAASIPSGGTVIDVGANIGCFALLAARRAARVLACEPHPDNLALLRNNLGLNSISNVEIVPRAVSSDSRPAPFVLPDDDSFVGRYSLYPGRGSRTIEVPCITLGELMEESQLAEIDLLKIDCQGSEYEIVFGLPKDKLSRIAQIIVECEVFPDRPEWTQSALEHYLCKAGFRVSSSGNIVYAHR